MTLTSRLKRYEPTAVVIWILYPLALGFWGYSVLTGAFMTETQPIYRGLTVLGVLGATGIVIATWRQERRRIWREAAA